MKKYMSGLMLLFVFFLTGCPKSGDSPTSPSPAGVPSVSITSLSPSSARANTYDTLTVSFSFTDTAADLGNGTAVVTWNGSQVVSGTLSSSYNITSGRSSAHFSGNSGSAGTKQVCIQLTDNVGNASNNACADFTVY